MADRLTAEHLRVISDEDRALVLRVLAEDAFDVLNWARRLGLKRDQQIEQVVRTFEVTLGYRQPEIPSNGASS